MITTEERDLFIQQCVAKGWNIKVHNHSKTEENWLDNWPNRNKKIKKKQIQLPVSNWMG